MWAYEPHDRDLVDHAVRLTGRKFRLNERKMQALRARWEAL